MLEQCDDAFMNYFVNRNVYSLCCQTRNAKGDIVDVIPAVPDADPCYHTGASLIDMISLSVNKFVGG